MFKSLSGRFLILTIVFVMLAEVLVFAPSVARFREDYLLLHLERAEIASMALLADDMLSDDLEQDLLERANVYNVVLRRAAMRELALSSPLPEPVSRSFDLRDVGWLVLIRDALVQLGHPQNEVIRVLGHASVPDQSIEVTMDSAPLWAAMMDYALRILWLSLLISTTTGALLFFVVRRLIVIPVRDVSATMRRYAEAPEDAHNVVEPRSTVRELREAEEALQQVQLELTSALRQKERLAQLGSSVAKISHDLRNILTTAQLFTDRIEDSEDPTVRRLAPKLVGSISRAVNLCESALAFGRAEEPAPRLTRVPLAGIVQDVFAGERLATGDYDISFSDDVPASLIVRADPEQLYRVLLNLVRNARQAIMATGKPGEIAIAASEDDTAWRITLRDTGPGLPQKARAHLFEPFQGRASKGGSGLGLVIAAEILRGHGGGIELRETGPEGTCFEIWLPQDGIIPERRI